MAATISPITGWILIIPQYYFALFTLSLIALTFAKTLRNLSEQNRPITKEDTLLVPIKTTQIARALSNGAKELLRIGNDDRTDNYPADHRHRWLPGRFGLRPNPPQNASTQPINEKWDNQLDTDDGWLEDKLIKDVDEEEDIHQTVYDAQNRVAMREWVADLRLAALSQSSRPECSTADSALKTRGQSISDPSLSPSMGNVPVRETMPAIWVRSPPTKYPPQMPPTQPIGQRKMDQLKVHQKCQHTTPSTKMDVKCDAHNICENMPPALSVRQQRVAQSKIQEGRDTTPLPKMQAAGYGRQTVCPADQADQQLPKNLPTNHLQRIICLAMALSWKCKKEALHKQELSITSTAATMIQAQARVWMH